jgi:hypothetical protein
MADQTESDVIGGYWTSDPDHVLNDFSNSWCTGHRPAGFAMTARSEIFLANPRRDIMALVFACAGGSPENQGKIAVHVYDDPVDVLDPDSTPVDDLGPFATVTEALVKACEAIGCEVADPRAKAAAPA